MAVSGLVGRGGVGGAVEADDGDVFWYSRPGPSLSRSCVARNPEAWL
jgi:hypothetical protein